MNCSKVSNYENVSLNFCSESVLFKINNNVFHITMTSGNRIFCPFCVQVYDDKFVVLDHFKKAHLTFLRWNSEEVILSEKCPFCFACFYGRHIVVKHVLQFHAKVIVQLYLGSTDNQDSTLSKCYFCDEFFSKNIYTFITHVESIHILEFSELFEAQFMAKSDFYSGNINVKLPVIQSYAYNENTKSYDEKNFDFSCWKKLLFNIENTESDSKSALKYNTASKKSQTKTRACRVLKFDIHEENKENVVSAQNMNFKDQIKLAKNYQRSDIDIGEDLPSFKIGEELRNINIKPLRCSTPKTVSLRINSLEKPKLPSLKNRFKIMKEPTFKSYLLNKDTLFQCSKCKKQFQENMDLDFHIKRIHKVFVVNLIHPCYQCAICQAKFYKNHYLKKHIQLHRKY